MVGWMLQKTRLTPGWSKVTIFRVPERDTARGRSACRCDTRTRCGTRDRCWASRPTCLPAPPAAAARTRGCAGRARPSARRPAPHRRPRSRRRRPWPAAPATRIDARQRLLAGAERGARTDGHDGDDKAGGDGAHRAVGDASPPILAIGRWEGGMHSGAAAAAARERRPGGGNGPPLRLVPRCAVPGDPRRAGFRYPDPRCG